jgi:CHAD domain-containing protein
LTQQISANQPFVEAVRQSLREQGELMTMTLQQACSDNKEEAETAVHDARVALRRSLALLEQARPWIDKSWIQNRRKDLRLFQRQLSSMRDLDVLMNKAEQFYAQNEVQGSDALLAILRDRQNKKRQDLARCLQSKEAVQRLGKALSAVSTPEATLHMLPKPVDEKGRVYLFRMADCLPAMLLQVTARLTVYQSVVTVKPAENGHDPEPSGDTSGKVGVDASELLLHRLRLAAKDVRYSLAFAQPWFGDAAKPLTGAFKEIQTALGNWHDVVIAERFLQSRKARAHSVASASWLNELRQEKAAFLQAFARQWQIMTPAWFHQHLAACMGHLHTVKAGCACCAGCGNDPRQNG